MTLTWITPIRLGNPGFNLGERGDVHKQGGQMDLPRMEEGGLDAIFFAVFLSQGEFTPEGHKRAMDNALKTFDEIHTALEANSNLAELALTPDDAYAIKKRGKRAIYIGIENGYPIVHDLSMIEKYFDLGTRYITLCHSKNMDDAMLRALAKNGGVIQMCILSAYVESSPPNPEREAAEEKLQSTFGDWSSLSNEEEKHFRDQQDAINNKYPRYLTTVAKAVDHIDHIMKVAGIDHVGIGTDFDGGGGLKDCRDGSEVGNITLELVRRGYTQERIKKIWGGNFMRAFRDISENAE